MTSLTTDPSYAPVLQPEKGSTLLGLCIALIIATGITTALRFWSRALNGGKKFAADDWTALIAWPLVGTLLLLVVEWTKAGLGRHLDEVPLGDIIKGLKLLFAGYVVYNLGISILRISAILFYARVFQAYTSGYKYWIWGSLGLNTAWMIVCGLIAIFPCLPIHAFWDRPILPESAYHCSPTQALQLSNGIISLFMDFWILLLPLPKLWRLQMKLAKKVMIVCIFICGYCVLIFTVGRLVAVVRAGSALNTDLTWSFVTPMYWYVVEISVACISVSLPAIFHLVKRGVRHGAASLFNDRQYPDTYTSNRRRGFEGSDLAERAYDDDGFIRLTNSPKAGQGTDGIPLQVLKSNPS